MAPKVLKTFGAILFKLNLIAKYLYAERAFQM